MLRVFIESETFIFPLIAESGSVISIYLLFNPRFNCKEIPFERIAANKSAVFSNSSVEIFEYPFSFNT